MIGEQGRSRNSMLCLLLLGGFGLAFAVLGAIYLTAAVGVQTGSMKTLRACGCDQFDDPYCTQRYGASSVSGRSAKGRNYNSTSGLNQGLMSVLFYAAGNNGGRKSGTADGDEKFRKKFCAVLDREFTAGYLAVILGLMQLALVIPVLSGDALTGGKKLVLLVFIGLIIVGTITVCSCILHVYVSMGDLVKDYPQLGRFMDAGFFGIVDSLVVGNAIAYSLGYFSLLNILVQIGGIVVAATSPSPPPTMYMQ